MADLNNIEQLVKELKQDTTTTASTYSAIVSQIDGQGVVWVYLAGSQMETPTASTSAEVHAGDAVTVEWRNNKLYIAGNYSNPSAGVTRVGAVETVATNAQTAASVAYTAANNAVSDAARAHAAADEAEGHAQTAMTNAGLAATAASNAQTSANEAKASAYNANEYATRALGNLATVESVAETLAWVTEHGTMTKTGDYVASSDTSVVSGKKYYTRSGSGTSSSPYVYTLVTNPSGNPSTKGYYEGKLDPSHVYFVVDNSGDYQVGSTHYSLVIEPDIDDISTYYELSIDESLNNYVGTHLALTDEGLWLLPATTGTHKVLIAVGGSGHTYSTAGTYIINSTGGIVASFRADGATIGENLSGKSRTEINADGMKVYKGGTADSNIVASFGDTVQIGKSGTGHTYISSAGMKVYGSNGTVELANIGYGNGNASSGTGYAPYYTLGSEDEDNIEAELKRGNWSFVEGTDTWAGGYASHAEGLSTSAMGQESHAEGYNTSATGPGCHAEGASTTASGAGFSHAEGNNTTASNSQAHAEGTYTTASGHSSHAEGYGTTASGGYSHSGGQYTIAGYLNQTVIGRYNSNKSDTVFEIGNGTADAAASRSNALTVDWNGNVDIASGGQYKIGGTSLIDIFYPVGSYYETSDTAFDPNTAWGGTWSLETAGTFHISAGTGYTAGSTGGSKDAIVVSHSHTGGNGSTFGFVTYEAGKGTGRAQVTTGTGRYAYLGGSGASSADSSGINYSSTTSTAGSSGTNANLPPYVAVNRWHRTA